MNGLFGVITVLAQTHPAADRGGLARSAVALWIVLATTGLVLVAVVWTILSSNRKRRERRLREDRRQGKPIKDAWEESARRLEVEPLEDPDDDDLRVDH